MSNTPTGNVTEYYRLVTEVDINLVARELLGPRITTETNRLLQCDCPNHKSIGKRSLQVWLDKQGFFCHGCRMGGDVLQLVEFIQSRTVTAGRSGPMPETHKRARDYLAAKVSLPPLGQYGLPPEQLQKIEAERKLEVRVGEALTALAEFYHRRLKEAPKVLEWLHAHYGISDETIDSLQIGFAANGACKENGKEYKGVLSALTKRKDPFTLRELGATGAFNPTSQDSLYPFFDQRIIFPYWSRGRVVFMIGRQTPWTPDNKYERGRKYKKLRVHKDDRKNDYIAPSINNSHLYNEDCLLTRPDRVIITEGVTDCIALMERGFPVVSPVTVRIRESDWGRVLPELQGVKTVYICQDNEISEVGLNGALKTASVLIGHKIETKLVVLPLDEKQQQARRELRERFDLDAAVGAGDLTKLLQGRPQEDVEEAERLLAAAKIDVNDYFASGHSATEFETLLGEATTPLEFGIDRLPTDVAESARNQLLDPVLGEVAALSPLEQNRHLKRIQERFGKSSLSLTTLRQQVQAVTKELKEQARQEKHSQNIRKKHLTNAPAGSCRARIAEVLMEAREGPPDYTEVAEAAYQWFTDHGAAQFFYTRHGEPFVFFDNTIYWMDSADRGRKRQYSAMLYKQTGLVPPTGSGRIFFEVLSSLALIKGQMRDHFSWLHTDVPKQTVYFNLNNDAHEIVKITPDGVEILKNGGNNDGVILDGSRKMKPIRFLADVDLEEADRLLSRLIFDNLTCAPGERSVILSWLCCFLLIDFAGTRPMTRFEGPAGSGKTTASKLISALIYGEPQQKKSTDAANYTDGSQNPLIVLDNIEARQMTEELITFSLTSITGIAKEKRKSGTDTETVIERTKCLLNTTGIEPLGGELSEILSRSFIITFDLANQASDCFLESEVISGIQRNRDLILSAILKRTSQVLTLIRQGALRQVMRLLGGTLPGHEKQRCNDFLSLMYLMTLARCTEREVATGLEALSPQFVDQIRSINATSQQTARESNPIATALHALFDAYQNAEDLDTKARDGQDDRANHVAGFIERYLVRFEDRYTIEPISAGKLLAALRSVAAAYRLEFEYSKPAQLARRISNDLEVLLEAGFEIDRELNTHTKNLDYWIRKIHRLE